MKLLLDTHIWLWSAMEPGRVSRKVLGHLQSRENEVWLSPISIWELLILCSKGRVVLEEEPTVWVRRVLSASTLREAPLTYDIALESQTIRLPHRDPADRFLAATAKVLDLTLVTADEQLSAGKEWKSLLNR